MFYVQRDAQGQLARVESAPYGGETEMLAADHPEIQAWYSRRLLKQSDLDMIRVLDDLIQVLTEKGVIRITDLPPAAQSKLMQRSQTREALGGLAHLVDDDEKLL
ncbi:tryptophan synthase subunit beta [Pseudomonas sp. R5(2019)]|uniref:tryptophan synthase subunit beta n=1 Tax=Pseudomonas sp. R5(2019) TaxID=2697566 RepID=UPI001411FE08|nr:tryptophan synthase subunit beta [Pseudomonas sp. R5(2019)]NBA97837.1 tryptophan synthase subunit beta [Pseudomonas sp. R5(2019)]